MYARILVPVDGSTTSDRGLDEAIRLAKALKSTLVLLHVVDDFPWMVEMASQQSYDQQHHAMLTAAEKVLAQSADAVRDAGVEVERVLRDVKAIPVADVIIEETAARKCELVVMGTHGRRGLRRLAMGSNAELVMRHSVVPVLLLRMPQEER